MKPYDRIRSLFRDARGSDLAHVLVVYAITRAALALYVYLTGQYFVWHAPRHFDAGLVPDNYVLNALFGWDAIHYHRLAAEGYSVGAGMNTTVPFFPGFPLAARFAGKLFGSDLIGGIVVNHVCSIAASFLLARLVRRLGVRDPHGDQRGVVRDASLFWLASPLTIFFSVYLSESLFGFASVAMLWAVVAGRFPVAMLAGIVATATRNAGVIVVAAAAVLAWERRATVRVGIAGWTALALAPLGLVALMAHQHLTLGNAFAWVEAQRAWGRELVPPWRTFADDWQGFPRLTERDPDKMYRTQEALAMVLTAPLLFLRKRFNIPWGIWLLGVGQWLLPVCSHSLISIARYQAGNVYFALAIPALVASRPTLRALVFLLFGMVLAWYASTYAFGNWAT